jgi:hypothetical protein
MPIEKPKPIWGLSKGDFKVPDDIDGLNAEIEALFNGPWEPEASPTAALNNDTLVRIEISKAGQRSKDANRLLDHH